MIENRDDEPKTPAEDAGESEETPLQQEIKAAIHRIFELLGQERPEVTVPQAQAPSPAVGLPEEVRRALAESMARRPPVAVPLSALQGEQSPQEPPGDRKDPEQRPREFLAALKQTIANLERIHEGLDPEGAEEVRKILGQLGRGGGPGDPVN
jgi:hypothetical protein